MAQYVVTVEERRIGRFAVVASSPEEAWDIAEDEADTLSPEEITWETVGSERGVVSMEEEE
jgi:hypothetical protein